MAKDVEAEEFNLPMTDADRQIGLSGFPDPEPDSKKRFRRVNVRAAKARPESIRKNYPLIHSLTATLQTNHQQKLMNMIIKCVQTQERDADGFWSMPFSDLKVALNLNTNNRTHISAVANSMQEIKMHFDMASKDLKNPKLVWIVFVPTILYESGEVRFKINSDVEHLFSKDHRYALLEEREMAALKLQCSVRLYELVCQDAGIQHSALMPWEMLRGLIMAKDIPKKAETWSGFSERYLIPSIHEVSMQTRFNVELDVIKRGKFVHQVRLLIKLKNNRQEVLSGISETPAHAQMRGFLEGWPLPNGDILSLFGKYSIEDIQNAYAHTLYRSKFEKYQLKHPHKYFLRSLEHKYFKDYPDCAKVMGLIFVSAVRNEVDDEVPDARRSNVEDTVTIEDIDRRVMLRRQTELQGMVDGMPAEQRHALFSKYNDTLKDDRFKLNIGRRNRAGSMSMFRHWYGDTVYGAISAEERELAKQAILAEAVATTY